MSETACIAGAAFNQLKRLTNEDMVVTSPSSSRWFPRKLLAHF